jgi:flagellar hook-associated protein 2
MNISGVINLQLQLARLGQAGQSSSSNAVSQLLGTNTQNTTSNSVSQLLAPVSERLSQQLASTNVKLSAFGQIQSAFSSAQTAANSLTTAATSNTATNAEVAKAAQAFVAAYNQSVQAVSTAVSGKGALASDLRATRAGNDLAQSLTSGAGPANLAQAGISLNKNGTLTLDTKALEQALESSGTQTKAALAYLGQQVGAATGRELASAGNVGASVGSLTSRSQTLAAQQATLQQQSTALQNTLTSQGTVLNYLTATGLNAYRNLMV